MTGLNGYLLCLAFAAAAVILALEGSWLALPCAVATVAVFARWPVDVSK